MKKCTILIDDEVNCRIAGLSPQNLEFLWDKFGIMKEGARHTPQFQLRRWDGKIRFFDKNGKTFTKLLEEIIPYIISWDYEIDLVDKRIPSKQITQKIDNNYFNVDGFKLRPYQVDNANLLLNAGSGVGLFATGFGKTSLCAAIASVLFENEISTIIIVPSSDLVTQTFEDLKEKLVNKNVTIGQYSGSEKDINHGIVVATWQSLQNAPHLMSYFQAVIVDECHGTKGTVIRDLINEYGKHITFRYGITGTLPKDDVDSYNIKLSLGNVIAEVPAKWLIENGYLSEIEIQPIETQDEDNQLPDYGSEKTFLSKNDDRLIGLAAQIMSARDDHGNTLVLVNSIAQGRLLQEIIPDSVFLSGSSEKTERKEQYDSYADKDNLIVIATFGIASTGISIDRIFCLIMVDAGKSFIRAIQSIGRGLRKKGDKNKVYVKDIYSRLKFSKKHFKARKKYYDEAGYKNHKSLKFKYLD